MASKQVVNLNTCAIEELRLLPGIGRTFSMEIVKLRNNLSRQMTHEDINNIGDKNLRNRLTEAIEKQDACLDTDEYTIIEAIKRKQQLADRAKADIEVLETSLMFTKKRQQEADDNKKQTSGILRPTLAAGNVAQEMNQMAHHGSEDSTDKIKSQIFECEDRIAKYYRDAKQLIESIGIPKGRSIALGDHESSEDEELSGEENDPWTGLMTQPQKIAQKADHEAQGCQPEPSKSVPSAPNPNVLPWIPNPFSGVVAGGSAGPGQADIQQQWAPWPYFGMLPPNVIAHSTARPTATQSNPMTHANYGMWPGMWQGMSHLSSIPPAQNSGQQIEKRSDRKGRESRKNKAQKKHQKSRSRSCSSSSRSSSSSSSSSSGSDECESACHGRKSERVPWFDGTIKWRAYYLQFKAIVGSKTNSEKRRILLQALKGKPLEYVASLSRKEKRSWPHLKEKLAKRFDRVLPPSSARQVCSVLKQAPEESIMDFGARVTEGVEQGYGQLVEDVVKEELMAEFFLKGCSDKVNACKALERQPNTLKKALEYMERYAYTSSFIYGKHPSVGVHAVRGSEMTHAGNWSVDAPFESNHHQGYRGQQEQGRSNLQRRCYACDQVGHIKRDCPNVSCYQCHQHGHRGWACPNSAAVNGQVVEQANNLAECEGAARVNGVAQVSAPTNQRKQNPFEVDVQLDNGKMIRALIDTGADVTMLNSSFKRVVNGSHTVKTVELKNLVSDGRCTAEVLDNVCFSIGGVKFAGSVCLLPMNYDMILGADFLSENDVLLSSKGVSILPRASVESADSEQSDTHAEQRQSKNLQDAEIMMSSTSRQSRVHCQKKAIAHQKKEGSVNRSCTVENKSQTRSVTPQSKNVAVAWPVGDGPWNDREKRDWWEESSSISDNFVDDWYT